MINKALLIPIILFCTSCTALKKEPETNSVKFENIVTDEFELFIPENQESLLILFPCFPCDAGNTQAEFKILELAIENKVAVIFMNFNQHLWLSQNEKISLETTLRKAISEFDLNTSNTFIGGFSGGGNVTMLLGNYLKSTASSIQPMGIFIVDAPIDLMALYKNALKNIDKNFSEVAVNEATWIRNRFDNEFGIGDTSYKYYAMNSPFLFESNAVQNLSSLHEVKIRFYTEPDTTWWKENRLAEYEDMNAFYIEQLSIKLKEMYGDSWISLIQTKNKGYRANGERHPHSWAIVDPIDLIKWITEEQ